MRWSKHKFIVPHAPKKVRKKKCDTINVAHVNTYQKIEKENI